MFSELSFILRKNGYLDFDSYLMEEYNDVSIKNILLNKSEKESTYWFKIKGNKYMFKPCPKKEAIKELLASEMLEYVGYEHASYDLACINGEYGVITRNLKKDYCHYISGDELIQTYYEFIDANVDKSKDGYEDRFNNLSDIWDMLEIKYYSHPNKNNIIKEIMNGLVEKFMFDILICQWDGASYNWIIEETNNYAKLFPIHDNEKMLNGLNVSIEFNKDKDMKNTSDIIGNLKVEEDLGTKKRSSYEYLTEIKKLLNYSDQRFVEEFINLLDSLTPNNIRYMIIGIESKIGEKIDYKIKNEIISMYEYIHTKLRDILKEELSIKR